MRYKIAVCDDEKQICILMQNQLKQIFRERIVDYEIDCFKTGEELCEQVEKVDYDLIFLDIELPKMDGAEVGDYIRETLQKKTVQIAYISSQEKYSMRLFNSRPINFLIKPITIEALEKLIDTFLDLSGAMEKSIVIKINREHKRLLLADILYFKSEGRIVNVVTTDAKFSFYDKLKSIYNNVKSNSFFFVHNSYVVNYRFIQKYTFNEIIMSNGEVIPISRSRRELIKNSFFHLKSEEIDNGHI